MRDHSLTLAAISAVILSISARSARSAAVLCSVVGVFMLINFVHADTNDNECVAGLFRAANACEFRDVSHELGLPDAA